MNQLFLELTALCQLLCIFHRNSMLLEVARKDVKPSGEGFTSRSSPACGPRIKLENDSRRMVRREAEDMAEPAGATLCSQAGCSGLARAGSKHLIGNPLGPPDVLRALLSKPSNLAASVLFKGQVSELLSCKSGASSCVRWSGVARVVSRETAVLTQPGLFCG